MQSQSQVLAFKQSYSKIIAQQKQLFKTGIDVIKKLNQTYLVDRVILRQAIQNYPKQQQLQREPQYQKIYQFFQYLLPKQDQIQRNYLKLNQNNQDLGLSDVKSEKQNQSLNKSKILQDKNYQANKNSISKFLKDETQHFQKQFQKVSKQLSMDQKGINGEKVSTFMKGLFETDYTLVLLNGKKYFDNEKQAQQSIQNILQMFYHKDKQNQQVKYVSQNFWIMEMEIIEFLDMWARNLSQKNLFVLYARSKKRLQLQSQFIISQASKNIQGPISHPSQLQSSFIKIKTLQNQQENQFQEITKRQLQIQQKIENQIKQKKHSKRQKLNQKMKQFYQFGCKRRYAFPKGITFDQIQYQLDTMNLEKFINFCSYYYITGDIFSREILTQFFKLHALNQLTLDFQRFKNLLQKMIQANEKVVDKLLSRQSPITINRKKAGSQLSKYKFHLRPLQGKDVETVKEQMKRRKQQRSLQNRIRLRKQKSANKPKRKISKITSQSKFSNHVTLLDIQKQKDDQFDPKLIIDNSEDKLWQIYQAKIWKKATLAHQHQHPHQYQYQHSTIDLENRKKNNEKSYLLKSNKGLKGDSQIYNLNISHNSQLSFLTGIDTLDRRLMKGQKVLKKMREQHGDKQRKGNNNIFQMYG